MRRAKQVSRNEVALEMSVPASATAGNESGEFYFNTLLCPY